MPRMTILLGIARREFLAFFQIPVAWCVLTAYAFLMGHYFVMYLVYTHDAHMMPILFGDMSFILMLICPILTMRLISQEKWSGSLEVLRSCPLRSIDIITGKFLGVYAFYLLMLSLTVLYPITLSFLGDPDWGPIVSGYLGLMLMGATFLAIGIFASTLSKHQYISACLGLGFVMLFWFMGWAADMVPESLQILFQGLSIGEHFDTFQKGILDTADCLYYLVMTGMFLLLSAISIERKGLFHA